MTYDARVVKRFWDKVRLCAHGLSCADCCWPWQGTTSDGYGILTVYDPERYRLEGLPARNIRAHRLACEIATQMALPDGLFALHKCNNRSCCHYHAQHVYVGTHLENMHDAIEAGTHISLYRRDSSYNPFKGLVHWRKRDPERSRHHKPRMKYSFATIQEIRHLARAGFPVVVLARLFGLRSGYVSAVVARTIRADS